MCYIAHRLDQSIFTLGLYSSLSLCQCVSWRYGMENPIVVFVCKMRLVSSLYSTFPVKVPEMTGWKLPPKRSIYQIDCLRITVGSHRVILGPMFLVPSESWVQEEYFKHWQTSKSLKNTWDMRVLNKTTNISAILPCKITKIKMLCTESGSYFFFDFFLF